MPTVHNSASGSGEFNVVVAGGGPAGVAAAVGAAREGASVLLVEKESGLGGNVRAAHVHSICGLYRIGGSPEAMPANGGIALEFAQRLVSAGGAHGPQRFGRLDVLLHDPESFAGLCGEMAGGTRGVHVALQTEVSGVESDNGCPVAVVLREAAGMRVVRAAAFVEATGDGQVARLAGLGWEREEAGRLQRPAYIFGMQGVEEVAMAEGARLRLAARMVDAVREGRLPAALLGTAVRPAGMAGMVRVTLDLSAGGDAYDPDDSGQVERLTGEARSLARDFFNFLRGEIAGFGRAELLPWAPRIGIRENRRVVGSAVLGAQDVLSGAMPVDTVCLSAWPMELHEAGGKSRLVYPEGDAPCGVPLRALRARDADNVFLAGRCVSATHEAQAALRVIGTSMAMGEAAGRAAARWADAGHLDEKDRAAIAGACGEGV